MPRYDKQSLRGPTVPEAQGPSVGLGVAASPVDLSVRASGGDNALAIAEALKGFVPTLGAYADKRRKEQDDADRLAGAKARDEQAGTAIPTTLREQSAAYQSGFMRQHGLRMSILDGEETERQYELRKNEPGFDAEAFFAERRQVGLKGMSDRDAYEGYAAQLMRTETKLRSERTKEQVQAVRAEEFASRQTEIAQYMKELPDRTTAAAGTSLDIFLAKHQAKGVPKDVSLGEWIGALVNSNDSKPQDFEHLYLPDASGTAPVNRKAPNGQPWRNVVDNAKKAAQERTDAEQKRKFGDVVRENFLAHDAVMRDNPDSITDPVEYVRQRSHMWNTGPEARAEIERIFKRKDEVVEERLFDSYVEGTAAFPRGLASNPKMKQRVERAYMQSWAKAAPSQPGTITLAVEASTKLYERTGVVDPFIQSLSNRVKDMSLGKDKDGKAVLSADFQLAYGIYKSLQDSNNQHLGLFDDTSRLMLQRFEDGFGSAEERFLKAQTSIDPKLKAAVKDAWGSTTTRDAAVKAEASALNPWFGSAPINANAVAEVIVKDAEAMVARGGNVTLKEALKLSREKAQAAYANDGHGVLVRIPQDLPRGRAEKLLKHFVGEAKVAAGDKPFLYNVQPTMWMGKPAFAIRSDLGVDLMPPRTYDELDYAINKAAGNTPEQAAERQNAQQQRGAAGIDRDRRWAIEALRLGQIDMKEFDIAMKDTAEREAMLRKQKADEAQAGAAGVPQLPKADSADPTLRIPVPQPFGAELSTKEIGMSRAKSDPFTAIMAVGEGFKNRLFGDPNQKDTLIGFGYNISSRSEKQVRADFARAGINDPERQNRVLKGEEAITPDEAARLSNIVKDKSAGVAVSVLGQKTWDALPDHRRAVLIDLAYQAGDNSSAFRSALLNLSKGNEKGVLAALEVSYWKEKDQKRVKDHRRNNLRLAMWESPEKFQQLVNQGV